MDVKVKQLSDEAQFFIKYCYVLPKDVLTEHVFSIPNSPIVNEIIETYGVESPEELVYHLYQGTWYDEA